VDRVGALVEDLVTDVEALWRALVPKTVRKRLYSQRNHRDSSANCTGPFLKSHKHVEHAKDITHQINAVDPQILLVI
jgi:hypothetical protein